MSVIAQLAIGAAVVLLVVGSLIWLGKKGFFEPDTVNEHSQAEREEHSAATGAEDFQIPFRRRVSAWSAPMRVFVGSLGLLAIGAAVATYDIMKTGSPAHQYLTLELRFAAVALIGIAGGVWLKSWFDRQIGRLIVVYEKAAERNLVEIIPYAKGGVRRDDGRVTIPEVARNRLLGLFWRYRQVGEDRQLRGTDKPLSDVVTHLIPDHGNELPDAEGWAVLTSAEGDRVISGATSTADKTYGSPNTLSDEEATANREKLKRKDAQLDAVKATNAELSQQLNKMEKKIRNEEYRTRSDLIDDLGKLSEVFQITQDRVSTLEAKNGSRVNQNGSKEETSAK